MGNAAHPRRRWLLVAVVTALAALISVACGGADPPGVADSPERAGDGGEARAQTAPAGAVAVVGNDGVVYLRRPGAADRRLSPQPPAGEYTTYQWPIWSPDGERIAMIGLRGDRASAADPGGVIAVTDLAHGGSAVVSLRSQPVYAAWAPDGRELVVVATSPERRVALFHMTPRDDGAWSVRPSGVEGTSIYVAWAADGSRLALRVGERDGSYLGLWEPGGGQHEELGGVPSSFHAPAWSPALNDFLVGVRDGGAERLASLSRADVPLAALDGRSAFIPSHDGGSVAVATTARPGGFLYEDLKVMEADGDAPRLLVPGKLLAYYWSADDRSIAYVTYSRDDGRLHWYVVNVASGESRALQDYVPSTAEFYRLQYFDQFTQSDNVWAPDGSGLVVAGRVAADGRDGVFVIRLDGSVEWRGYGAIASWAPRG